MTRLTRYLLGHMASALLIFTLILVGVIWLSQSLRFVDLIINKGVSAALFLHLTLLILPEVLALVLPIALFCAVLYTYERLNLDSEIIVLRAAGLSPWALARPALLLATLIMLVVYVLTLYLAPAGRRAEMDLRLSITNDYSLVLLQEGVFNTAVPDITIYVRERAGRGDFRGILAYDNRDRDRPVTVIAEHGRLVRTEEGPRLLLDKGNRQQVSKDRRQVSLLYFDRYVLDLKPFTEKAASRWRKADERFLDELFDPGTSRDDLSNAPILRAEGHRRLSAPLYVLALTLIALVAVLAGEFSRRGRWQRLAIAGSAAIGVETLSLAIAPALEHARLLSPLFYILPLAITGVCLYLLADRPFPRLRAAA